MFQSLEDIIIFKLTKKFNYLSNLESNNQTNKQNE